MRALPHHNHEIWSARLALLGFVLSFPATAALLIPAISLGKHWHFASFAIYGFGMFSMFGSSALLHYHPDDGEKTFLYNQLDYFAIALMIAGSSTPFCLIGLRGSALGGWTLAAMWAAALTAIGFKAAKPELNKWVFIIIYMLIGWLGLLLMLPLAERLGWKPILLTLAGGTMYTFGSFFFNHNHDLDKLGPFCLHDYWHICILGGAGTHYWVIYRYLLPLP